LRFLTRDDETGKRAKVAPTNNNEWPIKETKTVSRARLNIK